MTASAILNQYRRVAPVIGHKASAWVVLLTICEAADNGIDHYHLGRLVKSRGMALVPTLRRWKNAGLLTSTEAPARGRAGGRNRVIYMATPSLYQTLKIEPAERAIGPRS